MRTQTTPQQQTVERFYPFIIAGVLVAFPLLLAVAPVSIGPAVFSIVFIAFVSVVAKTADEIIESEADNTPPFR